MMGIFMIIAFAAALVAFVVEELAVVGIPPEWERGLKLVLVVIGIGVAWLAWKGISEAGQRNSRHG